MKHLRKTLVAMAITTTMGAIALPGFAQGAGGGSRESKEGAMNKGASPTPSGGEATSKMPEGASAGDKGQTSTGMRKHDMKHRKGDGSSDPGMNHPGMKSGSDGMTDPSQPRPSDTYGGSSTNRTPSTPTGNGSPTGSTTGGSTGGAPSTSPGSSK